MMMRDSELIAVGSRFVLVTFGTPIAERSGPFAAAGGCEPP